MSYPPAPWQLYGTSVQSLHLIDLAIAQALVPADFEIVSVLPGKTLGSIYLSDYTANSTLQYHELIVAPALVRFAGQVGAWISHIYVDNLDSVAGGRNIWGLPKEMAEFAWSDRSVSVGQGSQSLCQIEIDRGSLPLSLFGKSKISGRVLSSLDRDIAIFQGDFTGKLTWINGRLNIPASSPFAAISSNPPLVILQMQDLDFTANAPTIIGSLAAAASNSC
jgi:acetoacetate decarboxylase